MSVNYVNSGERIVYEVPDGLVVTSGEIIILFGKALVALSSGTKGEEITLSRVGRFTLPKSAIAIKQGETLYWNVGPKTMTTSLLGGIKAGIAGNSALSDDPTIDCILITNY